MDSFIPSILSLFHFTLQQAYLVLMDALPKELKCKDRHGTEYEASSENNITDEDEVMNTTTPSVPNYMSFEFFDPKFDHSSYIKKLCTISLLLL